MGVLVNIESCDKVPDGGGLVTATRLLRQSWVAILIIISLPEVPGLFSLSSSDVHDATIWYYRVVRKELLICIIGSHRSND